VTLSQIFLVTVTNLGFPLAIEYMSAHVKFLGRNKSLNVHYHLCKYLE